jgi:ribonuclease R
MSKKKSNIKIDDPFAAQEAQKYSHPIPSREAILNYLRDAGQPLSYHKLTQDLDLAEDEEGALALERRLNAMVRDGQLMCNRRGKYGLIDKLDLKSGTVLAHSDGYGFVKLDDGDTKDEPYLSPRQMRIVFGGDRVLVRVEYDQRGRSIAKIVEILQRGKAQVVGSLFTEGGAIFLAPDNKNMQGDILIPPEKLKGAKPGQIVVANLLIPAVPNFRRPPVGEVIEILGDYMAPGLEIEIALRTNELPYAWPQPVLKQAQQFGTEVTEQDIAAREDLRHLPFVTIDGEDAKDFDDAVYAEVIPDKGWKLYVAIADVSHYVKKDSALDAEALLRGNSVYFPGQVIPMLPEVLSNGLCSLNPEVDRLCLVCEMTLSQRARVQRYKFYPAVIHSKARLTYQRVSQLLQGNAHDIGDTLVPHLQALYQLYQKLLQARLRRGAIDFDFPETQIIFDEQRKIEKILARERTEAHRLIEECMLVANVCAAQFLEKHHARVPGLYRVHEGPKLEKVEDVKTFLRELGFQFHTGEQPEPKDYAEILNKLEGRPDKKLIETVLLRSLMQAVYTVENLGHFGLAYPAYTHFTSPIRRYPDLMVHRMIHFIAQRKRKAHFPYDAKQTQNIAEHCSMTERRADEATRNVVAWLKCEFLQDKLGEEFTGRITSAVAFGIFVELDTFFIEGLVHVTALKNDYYHFDAVRHCLRGERSGTVYRIGDPVKVRIVRVDLEQKQIDFDLV